VQPLLADEVQALAVGAGPCTPELDLFVNARLPVRRLDPGIQLFQIRLQPLVGRR